eukprot:gene3534-10121_t
MAAEQGHTGAAFIAAGIYYQGGGGVTLDFKKALQLFVMAAEEGNDRRAMGNIGSMYAAGHGTLVTVVGLTGASVQHLNGKRGVVVPPKRGLGHGRVLVKLESDSGSAASSKPKAVKVENLVA